MPQPIALPAIATQPVLTTAATRAAEEASTPPVGTNPQPAAQAQPSGIAAALQGVGERVASAQQRSVQSFQMLGLVTAVAGARIADIGEHVWNLLRGSD